MIFLLRTDTDYQGMSEVDRGTARYLKEATVTEEPLPVDMVVQTSVETDRDGRFIVCDVPIGQRLVLHINGLHTPIAVVQDAQIVWYDLEVDP